VRQVADGDRRVGQQGRGEDRQRRVLRAGNADFAVEAGTAGDDQFVHGCSCSPQAGSPVEEWAARSDARCGSAWNGSARLAPCLQPRASQSLRLKNFMVTAWMLPSAIHGFRWA